MSNKKKISCLFIALSLLSYSFTTQTTLAKEVKEENPREAYLTNFNNINITDESVKSLKSLKKLIKEKSLKGIYIEQWILDEPGNKNLIKKLQKIANKSNIKFYLIVGRNSWFGRRGLEHTLEFLNMYENYIDGIVLRVQPNKVNVWKDDVSVHAQILNQMLDAYSAIYHETKKRNKLFLVEFPFWLSDYKAFNKTFSQNACDYSDRVIFLIDDIEKLDKLGIKWNDVTCNYNINLAKRATQQTEESTHKTYKKIMSKLTFYSNFHGFIVDSDSSIKEEGSE